MNQEQIAAMFREQELQRRQARNEALLHNAAALTDEVLDEKGKAAHEAAVAKVKEQQLWLEKELSPGYWKRLWRALLNR